ncbi:hypothetical protein PACTADRAFT_50276 [Pachysolen tannophilus NRRL Y-2460]|uniref:Uncharacterized protein n=1 Tax=Pachysolen tannophilus NRRL Y-2460 TaxID=669874 RepID=A0A1E4TUW2_PACTA|nr:hypothetical protein PACTADRAFT_50276 [Pachysolen tannophilus NRRL Y-2460]
MAGLINVQTIKNVAIFTAAVAPLAVSGFIVRPTFKGVITLKTKEDDTLDKQFLEGYSKGGL